MSAMRIRIGAAGAAGIAAFTAATRPRMSGTVVKPPDADPAAGAPLPAPAAGVARRTLTTRLRTWSSVVNEPDVETGIRLVPVGSWPAGRVRLLAVSTPWTWSIETPAIAILVGSSVTIRRDVSPPARSTDATPSSAWRSGTTSAAATLAAAVWPSAPVPKIEAMMTGEALMSRELTCGVTFAGSFSAATFWTMAAFVSFTFVP